ncbi:MAG: FAD/NAD(P)-binding protein [Cyanobacteria bacterium TGS_CYA1]|nr:FAD/NAD(P)-binding protein [Cyanobacteria bacterium TGS_CYA1]
MSCNALKCDTTPYMVHKAIIRSITNLALDNVLFEVAVSDETILSQCKPGQFFQIYVPGAGEAPISISALSRKDCIEFCVRRVGRVTSALFQLQEGDWIGLRGPFGNGFPVDEMKGSNIIMVAGGLGVAPLRSLWQYLIDNRKDFKDISLVYGMKHSEDILFRNEFRQLILRHDIEVFVAAENINGPAVPSIEFQIGRVTDLLDLAHFDQSYKAALCGPPIMYRFVVDALRKRGLCEQNIYLSLERQMKCGIGRCGHCFIGGHFACKEGPVFSVAKLNFMKEVVECKGASYAD